MKVQVTYTDIWKIAAPIMLGSIAQTVLNVTDTAFLARVGETELGGSAIGGVFYFVLVMIGLALSIGAQILIARKAGEGNKNSIGELFDHTLILLTGLGIVLFLITQFIAPPLYHYILDDKDIAEASITFIQYRGYGILFTLPALAVRALFIGIAQTRIITYLSIITAVLNVIFDYALIFGNFGFEPLGIKGAGIATASAEIIGGIYVFAWAFYKKGLGEYLIFKFTSILKSTFQKIISISSPIVLQNFLSMGAWFIFFVIIEKIGKHELAISNIIRACYMILMTPVWGFSSASNSMVSNLIGQQKQEDVFELMRKIVLLSFGVIIIPLLLFALFPEILLKLTTSDPVLIHDSLGCFYIIILASVAFSISMNLLSAVSGTGDTRSAMIIEMTNIALYLAYIYVCVMFFNASVEVVWISEIIYWVSMGIWSYIYLIKGKWKLHKV
ncbi:MAG: MATE family efflux transporter [Bacteroidia bacterium]